jgi:hypothetical protein
MERGLNRKIWRGRRGGAVHMYMYMYMYMYMDGCRRVYRYNIYVYGLDGYIAVPRGGVKREATGVGR